jgi:hypothetical protein
MQTPLPRSPSISQILVQVRLSLARADLLPLPQQQHQRTPREKINRRIRALRRGEAGALAKGESVKANREGKDLAREVDDGRYLRRLRFIAIRAVGIRQGRAGLDPNAGNGLADGETDPVCALLHTHPVDDQAHGCQERDVGEVETGFGLAVAIVAPSVAVDEHVADPSGKALTDETTYGQGDAE